MRMRVCGICRESYRESENLKTPSHPKLRVGIQNPKILKNTNLGNQ